MDNQNRILAGLILNCKPEDLKGVAQKADGSLAVVAPNGMKFVFSPVELDNARDSFCLPDASIPAQQKTPCGTGASSANGNPLASIPARQKPPCGTGASSANGRKKEARP